MREVISKLEFLNIGDKSYTLRYFFLADGTLSRVLLARSFVRSIDDMHAETLYSLPEQETFNSLIDVSDPFHPYVSRAVRCSELGLLELAAFNMRLRQNDSADFQQFQI